MGYWGTMVVRELKHLTTALGLHQLVDTLHLTRHLGHRTQLGERWLGAGKVSATGPWATLEPPNYKREILRVQEVFVRRKREHVSHQTE